MAKKITFEEFLNRAKAIWGDTYEYVEPENFHWRKGRVEIKCKIKEHGSSFPTPENHATKTSMRNPAGCATCFKERDRLQKQKPFSEFLRDSQEIHGDWYDYDEATYDGAKALMRITCPDHGSFSQTPDAHINGQQGCEDCAKKKMLEESRNERLEIVEDKLLAQSDGLVQIIGETFTRWRAKADFICQIHGVFSDEVVSVLTRRFPCQKCNDYNLGRALTDDEITEKINLKEGNFKILNISRSDTDTLINIICHDCNSGEFILPLSYSYRRSHACPTCSRLLSEDYRKSQLNKAVQQSKGKRESSWLKKVVERHGNKYDYSRVKYTSQNAPIAIICPIHGEFRQKPRDHVKSGCRKCADADLKGLYSDQYFEKFPEEKNLDAIFYYVEFNFKGRSFFKIGITKTTLKKRYGRVKKENFVMKIIAVKKMDLFSAFRKEQEVLKQVKPPQKFWEDETFIKALRISTIGTQEIFEEALSKELIKEFF